MSRFTKRILSVEPSPTLAVSSMAKKLKAEGHDVVSFAAGEPDFNTPQPIIDAAVQAMNDGHTGYIAAAGLPQLRDAIAEDYKLRGREVKGENVIVTVGGKQALYNAAQVIVDEGDCVLIPKPYWVSYPAHVALAGGEVVYLEPNENLKITPESLRTALKEASKPKLLILCSPCNPTGVVYTAEELSALGKVLEEFPDVFVFFDAIYDRLSYSDKIAPDFVACNPQLEDRVVTFNGFSKTYAMTGWRLGYAIATLDVIKKLSILQSQSTSNATTFAQYGALQALKMTQEEIDVFVKKFLGRRDLMTKMIQSIPNVSYAEPHGAFYLFVDFSAYIGEGKRFVSCEDFVTKLLNEKYVAGVHGAAFGQPGFVRFSYATSLEKIEEGCKRLIDFVNA